MKNIVLSENRWQRFSRHLLELAQGNLNQKLVISKCNDDFEALEVLLNIAHEEWQQRMLHFAFTKPDTSQPLLQHFQLLLDKEFRIQEADLHFLNEHQLDAQTLLHQPVVSFMEAESAASFLKQYRASDTLADKHNAQYLTLLDQHYMYSLSTLTGHRYVLNLFRFHLELKDFPPSVREPKTLLQLKEKKRYRDLVEKIKHHIDHLPLSHRLKLDTLCKKFGINSFQLKKGFQELYQCSPYHYFLTLRMKHAYLLIETGALSFKEISLLVGYTHYPTFHKTFTAFYKQSPRALRKAALQIPE